MINFDNSATTFPKPRSVKAASAAALEKYGGNPGRGGHAISLASANAVFRARENIADFFGASPENVVFTLNCTHALNLAIKGVLKPGDHVIISSFEHNSSARPVHALSKSGVKYSIAEVFPESALTVESFRSLIRPDTKAIVCTIGSNVTGQIMPFLELGMLAEKHGLCFIADGAQACGVIPVKLSDGINILCTAGHKALYGPTGTGLLISDGKFPITPIMEGGTGSASIELEQPNFLPDSLESGTVNTAGIITLNAGVDFVRKLTLKKIFTHETALCRQFISGISDLDSVIIYRERNANYLPIVLFNIKGMPSDETASALNDMGFALRGGLHCSGLAHKSLGTLPDGGVRFAPSVMNSSAEVAKLVSAVRKLAAS